MFIKKRELERLLKEERERSIKLGFDTGYKTCQAEHDRKGFITGDLFQEIKEYLKKGV